MANKGRRATNLLRKYFKMRNIRALIFLGVVLLLHGASPGIFLGIALQHEFLHQRLLLKLEQQILEEKVEGVREEREKHLESFSDLMIGLEN